MDAAAAAKRTRSMQTNIVQLPVRLSVCQSCLIFIQYQLISAAAVRP